MVGYLAWRLGPRFIKKRKRKKHSDINSLGATLSFQEGSVWQIFTDEETPAVQAEQHTQGYIAWKVGAGYKSQQAGGFPTVPSSYPAVYGASFEPVWLHTLLCLFHFHCLPIDSWQKSRMQCILACNAMQCILIGVIKLCFTLWAVWL